MATEEVKLEESPLFFEILRDATVLYGKQPYNRKNGWRAATMALNQRGISERTTRRELLSLVCSKLGKAGGDASFVSRNQLDLFSLK